MSLAGPLFGLRSEESTGNGGCFVARPQTELLCMTVKRVLSFEDSRKCQTPAASPAEPGGLLRAARSPPWPSGPTLEDGQLLPKLQVLCNEATAAL